MAIKHKKIPKIEDRRGNLSFIQEGTGCDFSPRRVYWTYEIAAGRWRNGRALRNCSELEVLLSGCADFVCKLAGDERPQTYTLRSPDKGLELDPMTWREIRDVSSNAVVLTLASEKYDEGMYITNPEELENISPYPASPANVEDTVSTIPFRDISMSDAKTIRMIPEESDNGKLIWVEKGHIIDFEPRRVFYLYDVPAGASRGGHAHKQAKELIVSASGAFRVTLNDGKCKKDFYLNRPDIGLYVPHGLWRELGDFSGGAVCLVITSRDFEEEDYVRNFDEFIGLKG